MFEPSKRLGASDEGKSEPKKHGTMIAVSFSPEKRLGEDMPSKSEPKEPSDADKLMADACVGICKTLNVSTSAAPKLCQYLEAFFTAADSKPHKEGEHDDEETEDNETESDQ